MKDLLKSRKARIIAAVVVAAALMLMVAHGVSTGVLND